MKNKIILILILILSGLTAIWGISSRAMENHECFVSVTARKMLQNNDWVLPQCNGQLRLEKTPLSYWLVAGLGKITGKIDDFTARFPSALSAFLSAMAILYFVKQWLSPRIAIISALVWATSFGYINYAHNARPEMLLTFFITLCFLTFYSAVIEQSRKKQIIQMLVFWISFGLAMLAKGPIPLPLVSIPLFLYIVIFRQWKIIPKLLPIAGVIIFLAIVLPWPLAIGHRVNWDLVVWKHNFYDRLFGKYAVGNYPFYLYILYTFAFAAPWVAFAPVALISPFYKIWEKKQKVMLFLWLCFAADLIFLTISAGKRKHYMLPVVPVLAVLIGIVLEDMVFIRKAFTEKFAKNFLIYHIIIITLAIIAGMIYFAVKYSQLLPEAMILGITAIIIIAGISAAFAKNKKTLGCGLIFGGYSLLVICFISLSIPFDDNNYTKKFGLELSKRIPSTDKLVAYNHVSNRVVHYFAKDIPEVNDINIIYQDYDKGAWILATENDLKELQSDNRFNMVYYNDKAEAQLEVNIAGALFRKSQ
ncbi:MAG: glycosyltransferase family 39 protein [Phycisphaerae bacterium]|jgi:4-amino-4-deoxy-L-arabinose transferase-like glycosyltransferase